MCDLLCYEPKEIFLEGNEADWDNYSNYSDQSSDTEENMSFFATGSHESPFTEAVSCFIFIPQQSLIFL